MIGADIADISFDIWFLRILKIFTLYSIIWKQFFRLNILVSLNFFSFSCIILYRFIIAKGKFIRQNKLRDKFNIILKNYFKIFNICYNHMCFLDSLSLLNNFRLKIDCLIYLYSLFTPGIWNSINNGSKYSFPSIILY